MKTSKNKNKKLLKYHPIPTLLIDITSAGSNISSNEQHMLLAYLRRSPTLTLTRRTTFISHLSTDTRYPEEKQLDDIKPSSFYAEQGDQLNWFYYVDHQGRIYAEEAVPKNIATSIKAPKFLDFFYKQIKLNTTGKHMEYPWYSPCGKEHNFIKAAANPIVFQDLQDDNLIWADSLIQTFDPKELKMDEAGMLYHRIKTKKIDTYGLVKSSLGVQLSSHMEIDEVDGGDRVGTFEWKDELHDIHKL